MCRFFKSTVGTQFVTSLYQVLHTLKTVLIPMCVTFGQRSEPNFCMYLLIPVYTVVSWQMCHEKCQQSCIWQGISGSVGTMETHSLRTGYGLCGYSTGAKATWEYVVPGGYFGLIWYNSSWLVGAMETHNIRTGYGLCDTGAKAAGEYMVDCRGSNLTWPRLVWCDSSVW